MTIGEAIKHYEQLAENQIKCADRIDELHCDSTTTRYMAEHHRQLAEWLKELEERRKIQDILLQFIVDSELNIFYDELMTDETEQSICKETCHNHTKEYWIRWAKMKAREVNADECNL